MGWAAIRCSWGTACAASRQAGGAPGSSSAAAGPAVRARRPAGRRGSGAPSGRRGSGAPRGPAGLGRAQRPAGLGRAPRAGGARARPAGRRGSGAPSGRRGSGAPRGPAGLGRAPRAGGARARQPGPPSWAAPRGLRALEGAWRIPPGPPSWAALRGLFAGRTWPTRRSLQGNVRAADRTGTGCGRSVPPRAFRCGRQRTGCPTWGAPTAAGRGGAGPRRGEGVCRSTRRLPLLVIYSKNTYITVQFFYRHGRATGYGSCRRAVRAGRHWHTPVCHTAPESYLRDADGHRPALYRTQPARRDRPCQRRRGLYNGRRGRPCHVLYDGRHWAKPQGGHS